MGLLLFMIAVSAPAWAAGCAAQAGPDAAGPGGAEAKVQEPAPPAFTPAQMAALDALPLYSAQAVLISADDFVCGLYRGGYERIYPASMTKIMTALVALDNIADLDAPVSIAPEMIADLKQRHASMAGYPGGATAPARDLLYGAMLPSGAECSRGLAEYVAGSEEQFAVLMNQKAAELGMTGTQFVNATGLHNDEHYSTVRDIAVLLSAAWKNETFRQILTTSAYNAQPALEDPEGLIFYSTVHKGLERLGISVPDILGGKTGYTPEAGLCLAGVLQIDGQELILVTAGAEGTPWTEPYHLLDACAVLECIKQSEASGVAAADNDGSGSV